MRLNVVLRYMGLMLLLNAGFMLLSACISLFNNFDTGFYPLLLSFLLTSVLGVFPLIFVPKGEQISTKEGYGIVVGSWLAACMAGMMPYMLWGGEFSLINAWFESVSGYTTTGSTILNDVEALPNGMMFWRSATHWLGGVGVVMFALVVLPASGAQNKMKLSHMELSSMAKDNYRYKTQKILHILLVVYVGLTFVQTVLLRIAGMDWFDAVNNSFSTIATGGFSTDSSVWPGLAIMMIILFSMQCACAGSTAGGIKCDRVLLSFKAIKAQILQLQHPNAIIRVKMNGMIQDNNIVNRAVLFIFFYIMFVVAGVIIITMFGVDLMTSFGVTIASMGNVGPGLGEVGSLDNYHMLPAGVKFICTVLMLLGRLELFGFIQLFLIKWWK